ncbi:large ribosomal subunit protein eL8z-like [Physcomitrium patens]|uniref:large ribosomal subunit protein eL8z-like n=1 Tax=Physcomitrium patens TaxID=3218 RepID=UPI003CCD79E3
MDALVFVHDCLLCTTAAETLKRRNLENPAAAFVVQKKHANSDKDCQSSFREMSAVIWFWRALPPQRDILQFMKWPNYVYIQRLRRVLNQRLKGPPALNQFHYDGRREPRH